MKQTEDFLSNTEEYFEGKGIFLLDRDNKRLNINHDYLVIPSDITNLSPYELGEYLNAFTQQKIYIRTIQTRYTIYQELAKRRYSEAFDEKYKELTNSSKKLSESAKEKLINIDEEVRSLYYEYRDWNIKLDYLEKCTKSLEESIFLFSREISRRIMDYNNEKRIF